MRESKLTVGYLCEFSTLLGGERSLLEFLRHRDLAGVRPVVVAPASGRFAAALSERGIHHAPLPPSGFRDLDAVGARLEKERLDLVHGNSLMMSDVALSLGERLGVPAIVHVRDMMKLSAAKGSRLRRMDAVVAVSHAVVDWLATFSVSSRCIYNAVDPDAMRSLASEPLLRRDLGIDASVPVVGCVGQWALRKGQDLFVRAAELLIERMPDARFVLLGERYSAKQESVEYENEIRRAASAGPLRGRLHLLGYRGDVPRLLADLDLLVVPSRQEPLSRALLEGLALGLGCVATNVGGMAEILDNGKQGVLVPSGSPERLADGIFQLWSDKARREELRDSGPAWVRERFSPQKQATDLRELYDSLRPREG